MGCCFSDENSETNTDQGVGEISPLLPPGTGDSSTSSQRHGYSSLSPAVQPRTDESSALNKILTNTASNVIDVAQLESQQMEQHEYMDRARQYSAKLAQQCSGSMTLRNRCSQHLPQTVVIPQTVLSVPPISMADVTLITNAVTQASALVKEIKVKHKEDLVVPFGVP